MGVVPSRRGGGGLRARGRAGSPRTIRAIDRGALNGVGLREGYAVTVTVVAAAVALVMVVLLVALHGVSLDAPEHGDDAD